MRCPDVVSLYDHNVVHKIAICWLQMLDACLKILSGSIAAGSIQECEPVVGV